MEILVSAFEPFDNRNINGSLEVLSLLNDVDKVVLPVSYKNGFFKLKKSLLEKKYDIVLCLGEAISRTDITIEKKGVNINGAKIADNDNVFIENSPITIGGKNEYYSNLNVEKIINNFPILASNDAGTFICNNVLYNLLHYIDENKLNIKGGFIHIPNLKKWGSYAEIAAIIQEVINSL